jgi:hypothetical protein
MQSMLDTIAFALLFVVVFLFVHILFKNIHQVLLWTCKIGITTYICFCFYVGYQLHQLPQWEQQMYDSFQNLANMTQFFSKSTEL